MPLRNRQLVLWHEGLTPFRLRAAIRLNASVTDFGIRSGKLGKDSFRDLEPRGLLRQLQRRGSYWDRFWPPACETRRHRAFWSWFRTPD